MTVTEHTTINDNNNLYSTKPYRETCIRTQRCMEIVSTTNYVISLSIWHILIHTFEMAAVNQDNNEYIYDVLSN